MPSQSNQVAHPGGFIRGHVIPSGMSVSKAASKLGVSRPTLSKLLNGKSSLSHQMAVKLERAFGADHQELLDRQTKFDRDAQLRQKGGIASHIYIPKFLTVKAIDIHAWAQKLEARQLLPVLLRKLIRSTGQDLSRVDFPGYDRAEQKGWDGVVESEVATPWIPCEKSCWELSTQGDPSSKARSDYEARVKSVPAKERREISSVFVTARNWPTKNQWMQEMNARGQWKSVHAYDASDLEQWLEESISASIWFAEQLNRPVDGLRTLEAWWEEWRYVSDPAITSKIFEPAVNAHKSRFESWFNTSPEKPLLVTADSNGEAIAFLACLFRRHSTEQEFRHSGVIFVSAESLRKLCDTQSPFIPIVYSPDCQKVIASMCRRRRCIIVGPHSVANSWSGPNIRLGPLDHESFSKALTVMGFNHARIGELARESGRSPTVLQRRLSVISSISLPQWAKTEDTMRTLVAMALIGVWDEGSGADREILEGTTGMPYQRIEKAVASLRVVDDSPVWCVGKKRGVVSQLDAIFAICQQVTTSELESFLRQAKTVLSEDDPALALPESQRWLAALYQKERKHSSAIRGGINESLVILSVHGNRLFQDSLGINVENYIASLINDILSPLSVNTLASNNQYLPYYAEAAPETFLNLIEQDLEQVRPAVREILAPYDNSIFTSCPRTGLLWALECLAWRHLGRVNKILARLAKDPIDDGFANTPMNSLKAIYRAFMPQTSAALEQRIKALTTLTEQFPTVGWRICIHQLSADSQIGTESYRPLWRDDARGHGQPIESHEKHAFRRMAKSIALDWPEHTAETLCDLIQHIQGLEPQERISVLESIDSWSQRQYDDSARSRVRESIRRFAIARPKATDVLDTESQKFVQKVYLKLKSTHPVMKYVELFRDRSHQTTDHESGEYLGSSTDPEDQNTTTQEKQDLAIKEVLKANGIAGLVELVSSTDSPSIVRKHLALSATTEDSIFELLEEYLSLQNRISEDDLERCIKYFLLALDEERRVSIISRIVNCSDRNHINQVLRCLPFTESSWNFIRLQDSDIRRHYWSNITPALTPAVERCLPEVVENLLDVQRPYAAFHIAVFNWDRLETAYVKRILFGMATTDPESTESHSMYSYYICETFKVLDRRMDIDLAEMVQLEFPFVEVLRGSERGISGLEKMVATSPELFVEMLAWCYKRNDGAEDPLELRIEDPARHKILVSHAISILDTVGSVPKRDATGAIDGEALLDWVDQVRRLCTSHGRREVGDEYIGQLLARISIREGGQWPCVAVCQVIESAQSKSINTGFHCAVINERGVQFRGNGGRQERDIAGYYRRCSDDIAITYPCTSGVIETIAMDYIEQAKWWDQRAELDARMIG